MANYKSVYYAVIPRGLVDYFYIRIFMDNGISYDRYFSFNLQQKILMQAFHNILKGKQYAVQHLQSDYKRIQEIAEAIVKCELSKQVTIKELHPININLFQEDSWEHNYSV